MFLDKNKFYTYSGRVQFHKTQGFLTKWTKHTRQDCCQNDQNIRIQAKWNVSTNLSCTRKEYDYEKFPEENKDVQKQPSG